RETCQNFQLGWSPDGWQNLTDFLRKKGFAPEEGVMAGVLSRNAQGRIYDRFRARLIFPIVSLSGKTVAFGARVLDHGEPKYLNSSESPVYKKGEHLYGLYQARKSIIQSRQVCLTEGYLDVMALHQYGFANSCAVLGTALTRSQVRRLAGLAKEIILMFDGDKAGQKAALRSAEMILASGCGCRVLIFPEGEDAHSLLVNRGVKVFNDLLARSVQGLDYCLDTMVREVSPGQVMDWVKNFFRSISEISLQSFYIPRVAQTLGLAEADLRKTLDRERKSSASRKPEPGREQNQGPASRDSEILTFAACFPELRNRLDQNNIELFFCTDWARKFWRKIRESVSDDDLKLEQAEKDFYVQARMHKRHLEKNKETIFSEFEEFVRQRSQSMAQKNLKQALIRAQQSNDPDEVRRILALMQNTF
ncbi:MAG: DNA primase, partial [Desulfonatronovibrionaceae bacterium]